MVTDQRPPKTGGMKLENRELGLEKQKRSMLDVTKISRQRLRAHT
jgi:hypothetical protein